MLLAFVACVSLAIGVDVLVDPGSTDVHILCPLNASNPIWKKDNATIEDNKKGYQIIHENKTLIIKKIDHEHMGVYECTDGKHQISFITVFVPAFVKPFENSKNMIEDDPLQLECRGYGFPIPVVEWYKETELRTADDVRITLKDTKKESDSSVMINGTIRIKGMAFEDAGNYTCVARNEHGASNSTIVVNVKDKLAALWPFLGICAEVAILCAIIFIYEKRRAKKMQEEDRATEEAERLNANNETKGNDEVRQRK